MAANAMVLEPLGAAMIEFKHIGKNMGKKTKQVEEKINSIMTFQKFIPFLLMPLAIPACALALVVSSVLWVLFLLCRAINDIVWKLFENGGFSFHMQGAINFLDDAIYACYIFAVFVPATCIQTFDEDLY